MASRARRLISLVGYQGHSHTAMNLTTCPVELDPSPDWVKLNYQAAVDMSCEVIELLLIAKAPLQLEEEGDHHIETCLG